MKLIMLMMILITLSLRADAQMIASSADHAYISHSPGFYRRIETFFSYKKSIYDNKYIQYRAEINPFIQLPFVTMDDHAFVYNHVPIYKAHYTIGELSLRNVPGQKTGLKKHLIISGDSNTFGVGCNDDETLPYFLSKKFPDYNVINFGLAGTGPNSMLRFMELFEAKQYAPENYKHGAFILDFHTFVIQRIIGSKSYIGWGGGSTPRYTLNSDGIPVYRSSFDKSWQYYFYQFLSKLPYNMELFPDLPRIGDDEIELAAKVVLEIKKKYLAQTSPDNKFFVFIHPEFKNVIEEKFRNDIITITERALVKKLAEYNIEAVRFSPAESYDIPHYEPEGHIMPDGHFNYAEMIFNRLKGKL